MNTIPLFFSSYDVVSWKFQSPHFIVFRIVRLRRSYSTVQIYFIKSSGKSVPWYFDGKVSISSFRDTSCCHKSILFWFITNPCVFPCSSFPRPARRWGFWRHMTEFLKILWITILDFPNSLWNILNQEFIFIT